VVGVLYGSSTTLATTIGTELIATRHVPRLPTPW
jgi:hypothetical protein